jgi:uncharacterized protein YjbJ (UPF0337 family)
MDSKRLVGTVDNVIGIAKQKAGDLTENTQLQMEGIAQQVKGKIENTWGQAKDAVREANEEAELRPGPHV